LQTAAASDVAIELSERKDKHNFTFHLEAAISPLTDVACAAGYLFQQLLCFSMMLTLI
jgi:hypothetical protein